jgi:choice-of-anchor B domain-containing protein
MRKKVNFLSLLMLFASGQAMAQNTNVILLGNLSYPKQTLANVWGYAASGHEYALCGASQGLSVVEVTNPSNPIEIVQIPGVKSAWREVTVSGHFAYVVTEGSGSGLLIVDLSNLPSPNLAYHTYKGDGIISGQLSTAHTLQIDSVKNILYIYGSTLANGGAIALDLGQDPYNPLYRGQFNSFYLHGGYAYNDTVYGAQIYQGCFSVLDFKNKTNPILLQTQNTPGNFTHSTWLSGSRKILFATDELSGAFMSVYNISDLQNVIPLDKFQPSPGSGSIPHNVCILRDWAIDSWYRDGLIIVDAHRPENLVEVGNYDTYPSGGGTGMDGAWGVYPYLPSGNILVSNVNEGLFILKPNYLRACYLEGRISDSLCNSPVYGATISIDSARVEKMSRLDGMYGSGCSMPGTYSVTISKPGYISRSIHGITLATTKVTTLNVSLQQSGTTRFCAIIRQQGKTSPISGGCVQLIGTNNYTLYSDIGGKIDACNIQEGQYKIVVTKWGDLPVCMNNVFISTASHVLNIEMTPGYYDDFSGNTGWKVSGPSPTPWVLTQPSVAYDSSVQASPGSGYAGSCAEQAYVTNSSGGDAWSHDVDQGATVLTSPPFDISRYENPVLVYDRWFYDGGNKKGQPNDSMIVTLSTGIRSVRVEEIDAHAQNNGKWVRKTIPLAHYKMDGNQMRVIFSIADYPPDNIVEGGLSRFEILDSVVPRILMTTKNHFLIFPNPFHNAMQLSYDLTGLAQEGSFEIFDSSGRLVEKIETRDPSGELSIGSSLAPGLYFVCLKTSSWIAQPVKVVKLKL